MKNWLTLLSIRWGTYSGIGFLVFLAVLNPIARYGVLLIVLGFLGYLSISIYRDYVEALLENSKEKARLVAFSDNAVDVLMLVIGVVVGLFLGSF